MAKSWRFSGSASQTTLGWLLFEKIKFANFIHWDLYWDSSSHDLMAKLNARRALVLEYIFEVPHITRQFRGNLINAVGEQGNWGELRNPSKMAELLKETSGFS